MKFAEKMKEKNHLPDAVICVETGERFESIRQAAKITGVAVTSISRVLKGTLVTAGGFHWKYAEKIKRYIRKELVKKIT